MKNDPQLAGKNLFLMLSDYGAIIYSKPGHTEGTIAVEIRPGETELAIIRGLLGKENYK